ncbi:hypothetical protein AB205_0054190 [Aquarana catesbeiana]|uniref:Uncharacterized protein n=1 Tax=Aquarana catesbeiana TaxID=8400 RepID=A0A2G9S7U0_AQUCT|nr:hypothetical protein AB205_0054190 [Aquarana catesbeiana]
MCCEGPAKDPAAAAGPCRKRVFHVHALELQHLRHLQSRSREPGRRAEGEMSAASAWTGVSCRRLVLW